MNVSKSRKTLTNPRLSALDALVEVLDANKSPADSKALSRLADSRDNAFARNLTYGVLRWLSALEWLVAQLLQKPLKTKDLDIQRLLLLGLQQIWHGHTASYAAVNETAECARLLGKPWAVGLINALLRRFQREQESLLSKLDLATDSFAHPDWLLEEIQQDWPQHWKDIVAANNCQAGLWLRINTQRADQGQLREELLAAGFELENHPHAGDAIQLNPAVPVSKIPGFANGWLSVQDPAAQLARDLLKPQTHERILDACAAPGGKTAHLLESCPKLDLTVLDKQTHRVVQIRENLQRLGLQANPIIADAAQPEDWWNGKKFDKILLDAPCSATGVIRRHPEIKWLRKPEQVTSVVQVQAQLLNSLWPLLTGGGILVYVTCSILERENNLQIQQFLERHADVEVEVPALDWGISQACGRQILPGEANMDGFFYAVLRKSA